MTLAGFLLLGECDLVRVFKWGANGHTCCRHVARGFGILDKDDLKARKMGHSRKLWQLLASP